MKFLIVITVLIPLTVLALFSADLYGQSSEDLKILSVEEALQVALHNNREYKIAIKKQKIAREKVNEVWSMIFPTLESEAALIRQHADTGLMSLSDGQYDIRIVQLRFGINPGVFYNRLHASRNNYKGATENVRKVKSEISYNVIKSYFAVLLSREMIDLQKDAVSFLGENLKNVTNQYRTGSAAKYDVLQARVKLKSSEPDLIEAKNNYRVALDYFNYHLGTKENNYTADAVVLENVKVKMLEDNEGSAVLRLSGVAMKSRPEVMLLKMKKEAAENKGDASRSYYLWPTFSVGGYYGYNKNLANGIGGNSPMAAGINETLGDSSWQANWQIRFAATYRWGSLFPFDTNKVKARSEDLSVKEAEYELDQLNRVIRIGIKSSCYKLTTSRSKIASHSESVKAATEGLRIARESYRAGVIKNSDLLAAQLELTKAKTGYINSINQYYLSIAELKKETGVENEEIIFSGGSE